MKNNKAIIKIGRKKIGRSQPVFVVAEMSGNHNHSFARAEEIVKAAARAGADAIKLQTYTPDTITLNCDNKWFRVKSRNKRWRGKTLYQLYKEAYTPWDWQPKLKKIAESLGLVFFSTPFDETAVDFLEKIKTPAYKIASFEIGDLELLQRVGKTRKPVIISRGMADEKEIELALKTLKKAGAGNIALLHCVSSYPARPEDMNLTTIPWLAGRFKTIIGLSDHTLSVEIPVAAAALGARIIEKHLTLRRQDGGPDADFSLESEEFGRMVKGIRETERALGTPRKKSVSAEKYDQKSRRSLFAVKDIERGEKFTRDNVRSLRPGYGLPPAELHRVLNSHAARFIRRGTPLAEKHLIGG